MGVGLRNILMLSANLTISLQEYEPLQIFVNNPPDISDRKALAELKAMIHDFETLPHAIGPSATMFWLNDYQKVRIFFISSLLINSSFGRGINKKLLFGYLFMLKFL